MMKTYLETSWAPVNKLNSSLSFNITDGSINILWNNITAVQEAASHIFTIAWVTFYHLVLGFKAGVGYFLNRVRFMTGTVL